MSLQALASELARFLQGELRITQGPLVGQALRLRKWQRDFLSGGFAPGVAESALSLGRGNGKSTFVAGLGCASLFGPLSQPRAENIIIASSFGQARITFAHVLAFMQPRLESEPDRWRVNDTTNIAAITDRTTGAKLRCLGSDPKRAHGMAPALILADEPAQWPGTTADAMISALRTSAGKLDDARIVLLGTRAADSDHFFERSLNGGADFALTFAAGRDDDPFSLATWRKANPGLSGNPTLLRAIRSDAQKARRDPALLASFRSLRLNMGIPDAMASMLVDASTWERCEHDAPAVGGYTLGIDLGATQAMSAFCAFYPESGKLDCFAVFPASPDMQQRGIADGVGRAYSTMHERGELLIAGEYTTDIQQALGVALKRWGRPAAIASDRWREGDLREALSAISFPPADLVLRGQGFRDGGEDVRAFRRAAADAAIHAPESLLLRLAMSEARTVTDAAGNSKLSKGTEGSRRLRARDDAAAAAILAVAEGMRRKAKPTPRRRRRVRIAHAA